MLRRRYIQHALRRSSFGEWLLAPGEAPPLAAHVVVSRRGYTHHGIHVGGGRIVHYAGLARGWQRGPVEEVSLANFARGRPVWVRPCASPRFDLDDVIRRALSRLGENSYRILSNNCEHFCEWCIRGEPRSRQVESWRRWPKRVLRAVIALITSRPRRSADDGSAWAV
jgi:Lecithin retinol acyltransferase